MIESYSRSWAKERVHAARASSQSEYNCYCATRTNLVPEEISVFHNQADDFVTCPSCEFRYPQSRGACVMCGKPAPTHTPIQSSSEVASVPNGSGRSLGEMISSEQLPQQAEQNGAGKSIGIGIAVAVVLLVPVFLVIHNWQTSKLAEPVAVVTSTKPLASSEGVATPTQVTKSSAKKVPAPVLASAAQPAEPTLPAPVADPTELWKSVKSGNARAEVTLAKLYLEGNAVPQSCEQTHMLLLAASKKGYKAADSLLTGAYVQRCQSSSAQ